MQQTDEVLGSPLNHCQNHSYQNHRDKQMNFIFMEKICSTNFLCAETNSDEEANNKISNQGEGISNKIFPVPSKSENKYESLVNRLGSEPPSRQEIRKEIPKIKVSKPIVKRLANFTMALYIKWIVFNSPISGLHYQIGLKYFGKKNRKIRSAVSYPYEDKVQENKSNEDDFIILPNIYENTSIILDSSELLHPQNSYA
ncbi:unnamed protein product [Trichobilharzia regenti]|nr:unnamed protein product [Trichobilharzia regenti]